MTIESAMLDVETVALTGENTSTPPPRTVIVTNEPPGSTVYIVSTSGLGGTTVYNPQYSGQLIFYNSPNGKKLYCAVSVGGTLKWVPCFTSLPKYDLRTGKPYDANAGFYSPLAK